MLDIESIKNTVIHGDCLEVMKQIPDGSVDLTVTSPPYDNLRTYNNDIDKTRWEHIRKPIISELYRITKEWWVVVWVVWDATINGSETGTSFRQALYFKKIGFNLHDTMIYEKDAITFPDKNRYQNSFEYMFVFSKGTPNTKNIIHDRKNISFGRKVTGTNRSANGETKKASCFGNDIKEFGARWNIWRVKTDKGNNITGHPASFPEKLAKDHILSWSNEWDIVFDPFMWSWTTAVACINTKRNFIWIEISQEYIEIINKRLECITPSLF